MCLDRIRWPLGLKSATVILFLLDILVRVTLQPEKDENICSLTDGEFLSFMLHEFYQIYRKILFLASSASLMSTVESHVTYLQQKT